MLKKINPRVCFLALKIAFFGGFENDNIFSSKSYMVTKSGIPPQRKFGSLQNSKLKFIRYMLTHTRARAVNTHAHIFIHPAFRFSSK